MADLWVNNYNAEWLLAWNANMDIQICLDHFAIITYISEYYSKGEPGLEEILKLAWAQSAHLEGRKRLENFREVFLTHREMGMAEAFFRMLPSLHLKGSSVGTIFVNTDFPEKRHKFLMKLGSDEKEENSFISIKNICLYTFHKESI